MLNTYPYLDGAFFLFFLVFLSLSSDVSELEEEVDTFFLLQIFEVYYFPGYTTCITCMCNECHWYSVSDTVFKLFLMPNDLNNRNCSELQQFQLITLKTHANFNIFTRKGQKLKLAAFNLHCLQSTQPVLTENLFKCLHNRIELNIKLDSRK